MNIINAISTRASPQSYKPNFGLGLGLQRPTTSNQQPATSNLQPATRDVAQGQDGIKKAYKMLKYTLAWW